MMASPRAHRAAEPPLPPHIVDVRPEAHTVVASYASGSSASSASTREVRANKLSHTLRALEACLANPADIGALARAYTAMRARTKEAQESGQLPQLLRLLENEDGYPAWRRQALEEAYVLFFDDMAKTGDAAALRILPEPPTSEEMGFKAIPEHIASYKAALKPVVTGSFEDRGCIQSRKWDYDILRDEGLADGPSLDGNAKNPRVAPARHIVERGSSERYCGASTGRDPVARLFQALLGTEACCAGQRKAPTPGSAPQKRPTNPGDFMPNQQAGTAGCGAFLAAASHRP